MDDLDLGISNQQSAVMTVQALVGAIDNMANELSGDELFSELENAEYKEAFELFDKVSVTQSLQCRTGYTTDRL